MQNIRLAQADRGSQRDLDGAAPPEALAHEPVVVQRGARWTCPEHGLVEDPLFEEGRALCGWISCDKPLLLLDPVAPAKPKKEVDVGRAVVRLKDFAPEARARMEEKLRALESPETPGKPGNNRDSTVEPEPAAPIDTPQQAGSPRLARGTQTVALDLIGRPQGASRADLRAALAAERPDFNALQVSTNVDSTIARLRKLDRIVRGEDGNYRLSENKVAPRRRTVQSPPMHSRRTAPRTTDTDRNALVPTDTDGDAQVPMGSIPLRWLSPKTRQLVRVDLERRRSDLQHALRVLDGLMKEEV